MGRRALLELLRHAPERILQVFVAEPGPASGSAAEASARAAASGSAGRQEILDALRARGLELRPLPREQLDELCGSTSHQSFAARVRRPPPATLKEFIAAQAGARFSLVLMADSVYDPQNLGALMRAAECFGAAAMVWSRNRGCGLTPVVTKASVGASELLDLIEVSNLADAIRRFKDAGYWIVAADMDPQAEDLQTFQFPAHTVLVMGSEGSGLRELTRRSADSLVRIVTPGRIGSLNVSQATAVILHRIAQVWEASSI